MLAPPPMRTAPDELAPLATPTATLVLADTDTDDDDDDDDGPGLAATETPLRTATPPLLTPTLDEAGTGTDGIAASSDWPRPRDV